MIRVQAKQVPLLFAFHEKYTQNLARETLVDIPYHNCGQHDYLLNLADYVTGCLSLDCYSKYIPDMSSEIFRDVQQFLEYLVVNNRILDVCMDSFKRVLALFQIECCSATIWLNTFIKPNYRASCESALQSSDSAALKEALLYADHVNTIRIIPTLPRRLLEALQSSDKEFVKTYKTSQYPSMQQVMTVIGWLTYTYGSICLQDTNALLSSLMPESCAADGYSLYMYNVLSNLQIGQSQASRPLFTRYLLEET